MKETMQEWIDRSPFKLTTATATWGVQYVAELGKVALEVRVHDHFGCEMCRASTRSRGLCELDVESVKKLCDLEAGAWTLRAHQLIDHIFETQLHVHGECHSERLFLCAALLAVAELSYETVTELDRYDDVAL